MKPGYKPAPGPGTHNRLTNSNIENIISALRLDDVDLSWNIAGPLNRLEPAVAAPSPSPPSRQALQTALEEVRRELLEIRALLDRLPKR